MKRKRWHCEPGKQPTELDRRIMDLESRGFLVPTRNLIKTPEQIEDIRRAGVVNTGVLDYFCNDSAVRGILAYEWAP